MCHFSSDISSSWLRPGASLQKQTKWRLGLEWGWLNFSRTQVTQARRSTMREKMGWVAVLLPANTDAHSDPWFSTSIVLSMSPLHFRPLTKYLTLFRIPSTWFICLLENDLGGNFVVPDRAYSKFHKRRSLQITKGHADSNYLKVSDFIDTEWFLFILNYDAHCRDKKTRIVWTHCLFVCFF